MRTFSCLICLLALIGCDLFEKDERLLKSHKLTNGSVINIYYVATGATTSDVIQIKKIEKSNAIRVIDSYEHNYLEKSTVINDTLLQVILTDTGFHNYKINFDTLIINIK